jgi:Lon protease-like protein
MTKPLNYNSPLPRKVPIFPLTDVILLPQGHIKLNIFENRYLNMTEDCLSSNRIIGMIQPKQKSKLYDIGCIGKIVQFSEIEENKFFIELKGICRYKIINHTLSERKYRIAEVSYAEYSTDLNSKKTEIDKHQFLKPMKKYFDSKNIQTDWKIIDRAPIEVLVNSLAQSCPFTSIEKQALLEAKDITSRSNLMITLFEINAAGSPVKMN